jgi:hypothetical protein
MMDLRGINSSENYRYGFGGQEKDDEVTSNKGASYTAEFWQYDARLGRRWNIDQIAYPWQSGYAAFNNNPMYYTDPLGLEGEKKDPQKKSDKGEEKSKSNEESDPNKIGFTQTGSVVEIRPPGSNVPDMSPGAWLRDVTAEKKKGAWAYTWTHSELQAVGRMQLTILSFVSGGGGLVNGIRAGVQGGITWMAVRAGADAGAQFTANMIIKNGDMKKAFGNINFTETLLAGLGASPFSAATTSAAFQFTLDKKLQTTLTGDIEAGDFVRQSLIGSTFGAAGESVGSYLKKVSYTGLSLGVYLRVSSGMGQRIGLGVGTGVFQATKLSRPSVSVPFGIGVTEEYIENKEP